MKTVLHFIFNLINPHWKVTWLSMQYHRWENDRRKRDNDIYRKNASKDGEYIFFEVPGAGNICMSKSCHCSTGKVIGFLFGVEWGRYGFIGGVLGRDEAKRMADFILEKCSETTETMQEEIEKRHKKFLQETNMTQVEYDIWMAQYQ